MNEFIGAYGSYTGETYIIIYTPEHGYWVTEVDSDRYNQYHGSDTEFVNSDEVIPPSWVKIQYYDTEEEAQAEVDQNLALDRKWIEDVARARREEDADYLQWLKETEATQNSGAVDASTYVESSKSSPSLHSAFDGLDERFSFDLDDEFEIYVRNELVPCYAIDSYVFGNGAGIGYTIAIPIGENDFWDIDRFIQRGLEEYFNEQTSGSDYTYGINEISKSPNTFEVDISDIPSDVDTYNLYFAQVDVVPYQNISPYGEYGIDAGYEE